MSRRLTVFFLLAGAAAIIMISDALVMRYKLLYSGDETIAYMCATGNSVAYEDVLHQYFPYGQPVYAGEYKKYMDIADPYCFRKIATDLCTNDLHPPLYFWLLHLF